MIELGAVHDDLRVEFCRQSRPGMKLGLLGDSAIIFSPDADRHIVSTGVLAAVELDHGLDLALSKKTKSMSESRAFDNYFFPEIRARRFGVDIDGLVFADFASMATSARRVVDLTRRKISDRAGERASQRVGRESHVNCGTQSGAGFATSPA